MKRTLVYCFERQKIAFGSSWKRSDTALYKGKGWRFMNRIKRKGKIVLFLAALAVSCFGGCKKAPHTNSGIEPTFGGNGPVGAKPGEDVYYVAKDYEEVMEAIKKVADRQREFVYETYSSKEKGATALLESEATFNAADTKSAAPQSDGKDETYSHTNTQVEGVDEADVLKNDGKYLYYMCRETNEVYIVSVEKGDPKLVSKFSFNDDDVLYGHDMYILGDRLIVIAGGSEKESNLLSISRSSYRMLTYVLTYDISDRSQPKLVGTSKQDGSYNSSRCSDGYVYLFTGVNVYYYANFYDEDGEAIEINNKEEEQIKLLPCVNNEAIEPSSIILSKEPENSNFFVISSLNPQNPTEFKDVKAVMNSGWNDYVSNEYIYISDARWESNDITYNRTEIFRFRYDNGEITPAGEFTVKGVVNNQFSMDEYEGNLRIVTTVDEYHENNMEDIEARDIAVFKGNTWTQSNALYIYDKHLKLVGSIENLAENEHIESARFMGDIGYFVTFRQVDPLFSVDLSDPTNPRVLGTLKIPGFSEYLHPFGENLLLGIGRDADADTGRTCGVKLSMFDTSDPKNVKEIHKLVLPEYSYSSVGENHKSVLIDVQKNLICFPAQGYSENAGTWNEYSEMLVFGYDSENGFTKRFAEGVRFYDYVGDYRMYNLLYAEKRCAYVNNDFYIISPLEIVRYDMNGWKKQGAVTLVQEFRDALDMMERIQKEKPEPFAVSVPMFFEDDWFDVTVGGDSVQYTYNGGKQNEGEAYTAQLKFNICGIGESIIAINVYSSWNCWYEPVLLKIVRVRVNDDFSVDILEETIEDRNEEYTTRMKEYQERRNQKGSILFVAEVIEKTFGDDEVAWRELAVVDNFGNIVYLDFSDREIEKAEYLTEIYKLYRETPAEAVLDVSEEQMKEISNMLYAINPQAELVTYDSDFGMTEESSLYGVLGDKMFLIYFEGSQQLLLKDETADKLVNTLWGLNEIDYDDLVLDEVQEYNGTKPQGPYVIYD